VTWIAPDVERSEDYPARRNEPEREMLRDWLDWHRATLLRKCAGLDAAQLAKRAVPPSNLSLLGLVRHMSDTERGWVRQLSAVSRYPTCTTAPMPRTRTSKRPTRPAPRRIWSATGPSARPSMPRWRARKLDDTFTFREMTTSVRWMWQHLVEEYARHNGHADLLREAIDGSAGL
jgi:hypothetical protein